MKTNFTLLGKLSGLLLVLVLISAAVTHAQTTHNVQVTNNVFTPSVLTINVGDVVEWRNIEGSHNVNGTTSTYPDNPESFGNQVGSGWTYSHTFTTAGTYEYQCDPHAGQGMRGTIEVQSGEDDGKHMLTVQFTGMNPHVGQMLYLSLVEKDSGMEVERTTETVSAEFQVQVSGLETGHSYFVNFFADHNGNGSYDAPPTDHAWQMELDNVTGDETLNFAHNTNFTDIMWQNKLTVQFLGMTPHIGQSLNLWVIDESDGEELFTTEVTVEEEFEIVAYGIETGKSYTIDFYADHNSSGSYDAPPTDHAWRLELNNVAGDTVLNFSHNTNFTDIFNVTSVSDLQLNSFTMYPNPASDKVTLEFDDLNNNVLVRMIDISGKTRSVSQTNIGNRTELDISHLPQGLYFVQLQDGDQLQIRKLIKR
ncbi:T9SS type A sorting domain-containing protein [uncultured Draconibacterium sp.]|uniref:T9SS type A sorting domain-containing protein n=1 Tax=uncultured Draconibacterium sp. TaxID=1573823 RepID=UPI0025EF182F|nr:T9SS type A sorting domain-containing protein [uncultured Draconibacterium sp.]